MFGGMHRLHELSDKNKLVNNLIKNLREYRCNIHDVKLEHTEGSLPTLSCTLEMPYGNYIDTDDAVDAFRYTHINDFWPRRSGKNPYGYPKRKNPTIEKVHFSGPVTAVIWSDGTKTIVRCESEDFDHEKGLAMAIAKKFLGSNKTGSNYYDVFKKWIPEDKPRIKVNSDGITLTFENGNEVSKQLGNIFGRPIAWFSRGVDEVKDE